MAGGGRGGRVPGAGGGVGGYNTEWVSRWALGFSGAASCRVSRQGRGMRPSPHPILMSRVLLGLQLGDARGPP
jgi:hypothetical protein